MVEIDGGPSIPESELTFAASRAGGPGGQHVNKVASRVTLRFDVQGSPSLDEPQKRRLMARLSTRITNDGVLVMHCRRHRSQAANREELVERFARVVAEALRPRRTRKKTRPSAASRQRRLEEKRRRGKIKRDRAARSTHDD
jgi:ribosome-associated protein